MNRNKVLAGLGAVVVVALAVAFVLRGREEDAPAPAPAEEPAATAAVKDEPVPAPEAAEPADGETKEAAFATEQDLFDYMRERFGAGIRHKHTQIKAIEKLIELLARMYPDDWQMRLRGVLEQLFPELAAEMYAKYESLVDYNKWLAEKRYDLMAMSAEDRRKALWDMRRELFGEDADEIWEAARKAEQITDSLAEIGRSTDTNVDQKLDTFLDAIDQAYGDQADDFVAKRQSELMNHFLSVDTVQNDLHALSPEERRQELRDLRTRMGLDDAALERWDNLDRMRDEAWDNGQRYMQERERILNTSRDPETALAQLRERMFGPEAEIIASEEASGFFRYGHRRTFGRE